MTVAASTVWKILKEAGSDPAPERSSSTWADFLRSQAEALLACDFFETVTLTGTRLYVFAVIEHASRWIRVLGAPAHPRTRAPAHPRTRGPPGWHRRRRTSAWTSRTPAAGRGS
ncbi:hypothetical protein [Streptomyces hirsutus]|uniref:hypothetical protein n=1 Tax=Streptomyces hirsutus TaxID=35620 RepID=UPI0038680BB5